MRSVRKVVEQKMTNRVRDHMTHGLGRYTHMYRLVPVAVISHPTGILPRPLHPACTSLTDRTHPIRDEWDGRRGFELPVATTWVFVVIPTIWQVTEPTYQPCTTTNTTISHELNWKGVKYYDNTLSLPFVASYQSPGHFLRCLCSIACIE